MLLTQIDWGKIQMRNEVGNRYGKLVVVEEAEPTYSTGGQRKRKQRRVKCQCDCGNMKEMFLTNLTTGKTNSCGCIARTHGMSNTPEYKVWQGMIGRCHNPNHVDYCSYGDIGVVVCEEWRYSFEAFINDMGRRPSDNHTIDRKNVYAGYDPTNCEWVEKEKQGENKRKERRRNGTHPMYEYRKAARERKARGEYRVGGRGGGKPKEHKVEQ